MVGVCCHQRKKSHKKNYSNPKSYISCSKKRNENSQEKFENKMALSLTLFQQRHRVLLLNNAGAEYIRCGDYDAAIKTLGEALSEVKQCARMEEEQGQQRISSYFVDGEEMDLTEWFSDIIELTNNNNTTMEQQQTTKQNRAEQQQQQQQGRQQERQNQSMTMTTSSVASLACHHQPAAHYYCGGYVYSYPIELPIDDDIAIILKVQCVTIMFNLAMAFHLLGLKYSSSSSSSSKGYHNNHNYNHQQQSDNNNNDNDYNNSVRLWALENSVAMYELCYEMMGSEQINPGLQFIMSLTNNLGHSHAMLHNFEKAKICWQQLLSIQMFLVVDDSSETTTTTTRTMTHTSVGGGGGEAEADYDDNNDNSSNYRRFVSPWEGFFDNTSSLILHNICAPAA